jgi:8-oxo-dGTP diphosphatase
MDDWSNVPVFGIRPEIPVIRPSAYGLIEDGQGRLAVTRTVEGFFLPGGGVESGETPEETVLRESIEECGLAVRLGQWTLHAVQFNYSESEKTHFEKRSTFIGATIDGPASAPLDADHELVWMSAAEAAEVLWHESHRWAVEQWRSFTPRHER